MSDPNEASPLLPTCRDNGEQAEQSTLQENTSRKRIYVACMLIALAQGLERLSVFGIIDTSYNVFQPYPFCTLNDPFWTKEWRAVTTHLFVLFMFMLSLPIGILTDLKIPRHIAAVVGYCLHIGALVPLFAMGASNSVAYDGNTTCSNTNATEIPRLRFCSFTGTQNDCTRIYWICYILIAIGSALIRSTLLAIAASQIRADAERCGMARFTFDTVTLVHFMYWFITLGEDLGYGTMSYILRRNHDVFSAYSVALIAISMSLILFLTGYRFCGDDEPKTQIFSHIYVVISTAKHVRQAIRERQLPGVSFFAGAVSPTPVEGIEGVPADVVNSVKLFWKATALFLICIPCGCSYTAVEFWWLNHKYEVETIDQAKWVRHFVLLQLENVAVLCALPIAFVIYKVVVHYNKTLFLWKLMLTGTVIMLVGLAVSIVLDIDELKLSAYYDIIPECLYGFSQVFTYVIGLTYALVVAPKSSQGIAMGLFMFIMYGLGSSVVILPVVITLLVNPSVNVRYMMQGINGFVIALLALSIGVFIYINKFRYKTHYALQGLRPVVR